MAKLRYQGTFKKKLTWTSMGQTFAYTVRPGDIIMVPDNQAPNAMGLGNFVNLTVKAKQEKKDITLRVEPITPKVAAKVAVIPTPSEPMYEVETKDTQGPDIRIDEDVAVDFVSSSDEPVVAPAPTVVKIDYTRIRKAELKAMCLERGLSDAGNRDDLIAALVNSDNALL